MANVDKSEPRVTSQIQLPLPREPLLSALEGRAVSKFCYPSHRDRVLPKHGDEVYRQTSV